MGGRAVALGIEGQRKRGEKYTESRYRRARAMVYSRLHNPYVTVT